MNHSYNYFMYSPVSLLSSVYLILNFAPNLLLFYCNYKDLWFRIVYTLKCCGLQPALVCCVLVYFDQPLGVCHILNIYITIFCIFQLSSTKNAENKDFDQRLECTAPKRWLKYTTHEIPKIWPGIFILWYRFMIYFYTTLIDHRKPDVSLLKFGGCRNWLQW